jgi:chemotaxis protein CheD
MTEFVERRKDGADANCVVVQAGEITIVREGGVLMTVTGRGVAVCMWDSVERLAGMSHFIEPSMRDPKRTTARFGNVAVFALVRMMQQHSPNGCFEAHIVGGASPLGEDAMGRTNVEMARKVLVSRNVPVVSEDTGGSKGRKILFDAASGHVAVLKVHQVRSEDWGGLG